MDGIKYFWDVISDFDSGHVIVELNHASDQNEFDASLIITKDDKVEYKMNMENIK